ncbi:shikimate kinase [Clostridium cellulovorans]|uniref:Shikimate kinase n=1 Tax=Clostridium cellulovorans (strain ATCC 35296 / DSM 3052 / OCM 3 / 743B) TaxID=573061 RepID=D9SPR3_CLOC7|nr:shikimate kinase [Clostridium cellulovorans]ADL50112.1 Shikimate kinase [Clostridium cellulovorans 743B]
MKNLILIGMPGCGKSTIGKLAAMKLGIPFVDVDEYIENKYDAKVSEIFEKKGEKFFRDLESTCIKELSEKTDLVISTGGGSVLREENMINLKANGVIMFIDRSPEDIISDVDIASRPLLAQGSERIYTLYNERINLYTKYCDHHITNNSSIDTVVNTLLLQYIVKK